MIHRALKGAAQVGGLVNLLIPDGIDTSPTSDYWYQRFPRFSKSNIPVTAESALTYGAVWNATNLIAGTIASLPLKLYRRLDGGGKEVARDEALFKLLHSEPNEHMDSFVFWEMLGQWQLNYGNGLAEIQRVRGNREVFALWPIHPTRVVKLHKEVEGEPLGEPVWEIRNNNGKSSFIPDSDMFNIVGALSDDGYIGKGITDYAFEAIGAGLAGRQYRSTFLRDDATAAGVLRHPGQLGEDARKNIRKEWHEALRDPENKGNMAVLWEGMEYDKIGTDPEQAQLIEGLVFDVQELARFYELPPHLLAELSHGTYSNVEELMRHFVSVGLMKRLVKIERAIDRKLVSEAKKPQLYSKFSAEALLRGNFRERQEGLQIMRRNGIINADDWNEIEDRNPLPDGQGEQYIVEANMTTLDAMLNPPDPEPSPSQAPPENAAVALLLVQLHREREDKQHLKNELSAIASQLTKKQQEYDELDRKLYEEIQQGLHTDECLDKCERELREQEQTFEGRLKQAKSDHEDAIAAIQGQLDALHGEKVAMEAQLVQIQSERDELRTAGNRKDAELYDATEAHQSVVAKLQKRVEKADAECARLSANADQAALEYRQLEKDKRDVEQAYEDYKAAAEVEAELANELNANIDRLVSENTKLTSDSNNWAEKAAQHKDELTTARAELATLRDSRNDTADAASDRADELNAQVGRLEAANDVLRSERDDVANARTTLHDKLTDTERRFTDLQRDYDDFKRISEEKAAKRTGLNAQARENLSAANKRLAEQSLEKLCAFEVSEAKKYARKPNTFRAKVDAFYNDHRRRALEALSVPADAQTSLTGKDVHVAAWVESWVANSRKKLLDIDAQSGHEELAERIRAEVNNWSSRLSEIEALFRGQT